MLSEDGYEEDDAILARFVPRKANKWILVTIGLEFLSSTTKAASRALDDLVTVSSQRFNYEDQRSGFASDVGYDIEHIDEHLEELNRDASPE